MNEREIFTAALEIEGASERSAHLDAACSGDPALRQRVEALLAEHQKDDRFLLDSPPPGLGATMDWPLLTESPGAMIGHYKLLQQIGEGGMGVVWMAEQMQPVQRKVALKVIKPGMDSRQVIARFEAERQALAMMDHVNIARVLDAGTTESGLPYFVMELVHGVPITKYCDDNHLAPRERLELFVPVCQAIQHAHQKGIIHRDIKPSNVMVTLYDGKPVPKVIDFGVAKATQQTLTERTLFTQYGTMVGTLEYMSPEQAEMSALGVDTRSDIFSLGVLLYELLTGSTPLTRKRLKEAAYAEVLRMIKEDEPPKPSTRLTESGEAMASISAQRQMEPAKLTKLVRGDLDWIVMKCLEKDRGRRYDTAVGLAADLNRHLTNEPVLARPPSAAYRLQKAWKRNRLIYTAGLAVSLALIAGLGLSTWLFIKESETSAIARAAEQEQVRLRAAAEKARGEEFERRVQTGNEMNEVGVSFMKEGRLDVAERILRRAFTLHRKLLGNNNGNTVVAAGNLAFLYNAQGRPQDAEEVLNELLPPNAEDRPENFGLLSFRAQYRVNCGRFAEAAADLTKAVALRGDDSLVWLRCATTLLEAGDMKGYDELRERMLNRFVNATELNVREAIAKSCLLAPGPRATVESAGRLADTASQLAPDDKWTTLAKSIADYRRGSYTTAAEWARRALAASDPTPPQQAAALAVLTEALSKSGRPEAALTCLEAWDVAGWKATATFSPGKLFNEDWHNILVAKILLREAAASFASDVERRYLRRKYRYEGGCFSELAIGDQTSWLEAKDDWIEVYRFTEFRKSDGTVELKDSARNFHIRIPVEGGMSRLSMDGGSTWGDLFAVVLEPVMPTNVEADKRPQSCELPENSRSR